MKGACTIALDVGPLVLLLINGAAADLTVLELCRYSTVMAWPQTLRDAQFNSVNTSRAGPDDERLGKVVFRGSATGWKNGKRRSAHACF